MVRIQTDLPHTSVRREDAPQWRAPLGSSRRQAPSDAGVRREKPISLFIVPPRAQASRRCETTSDAKAASRQAPLAFRSLDPFRALRELDRRRRDEERPFPLRTKNRLTGKAPYKSAANLTSSIRRQSRSVVSLAGDRGFESISLNRRVTCELGFLDQDGTPVARASWPTVSARSIRSSRATSQGRRLHVPLAGRSNGISRVGFAAPLAFSFDPDAVLKRRDTD